MNISEHDKMWDPHERDAYRAEHADFLVNFGMEVSTDLGHMLAIGLPSYISGIRRAERLREELDAVGGFLIVAHPFRHVFDEVTAMRKDGAPFVLSPAEAARLPVFQLVDAIEVANGCNTPRENYFAFEVARELGLPGTGGSDAHSESGIGYYATGFGRDLSDETELLEELHGGRFEAVLRAANGGFMRFEPGAVEAVGAAGVLGKPDLGQARWLGARCRAITSRSISRRRASIGRPIGSSRSGRCASMPAGRGSASRRS